MSMFLGGGSVKGFCWVAESNCAVTTFIIIIMIITTTKMIQLIKVETLNKVLYLHDFLYFHQADMYG